MTMQAVFKIADKDFFYALNLMDVQEFTIQSIPRPYRVSWDEQKNPFDKINNLLAENPKNLLLIDERVASLFQTSISLAPQRIFKAPATEEFKTLQGVTQVLDFLQKNAFTKGETLVVVGGGIIQDVGAFVGACYKRGIPWVHFPTTLLSMCDSCIGGKTGINYGNAKNQLALFSAPRAVIINPTFLNTLRDEDLRSGLGEILKLFITGGKNILDYFPKYVSKGWVNNPRHYKELILGALSIKKAIVEADEFELNHRKSLNYGHTVGHAIEVISDHKIPHGSAVVIGILFANKLSVRHGLLDKAAEEFLAQLCFQLLDGPTLKILKQLNLNNILSLLKKDKKTESNQLSFVAIASPGHTHFLKLNLDSSLESELVAIFHEVTSA